MNSAQSPSRTQQWLAPVLVTVLLSSNLIATGKTIEVLGYPIGAANFVFPFAYLLLIFAVESLGVQSARRMIAIGATCVALASSMAWFILELTPSESWSDQNVYETVFRQTPRVALCSVAAFVIAGTITTETTLRMSRWTRGRFLWLRCMGAAILGQGIDSLLFYPAAFYGKWPDAVLVRVLFTSLVVKVGWQLLLTPGVYVGRRLAR